MRPFFALGLAGPEGSTVPNESHAIAGMFMAVFERKLGDAGFARSPRSSAINSVVLFLCGARERQIETEIAREFERDSAVPSRRARRRKSNCPRGFACLCRSVSSTREFAPVWEKTSRNIVRSRPAAAPRPRPSASRAVLMFITILTSAFTLPASPALPTKQIWAASSFKIGSAFRNASSFPPHIR